MATTIKRTVSRMIDAVGALIDITPTASTTPDLVQITDWLNEGVIQVFRLLPLSEFHDAYAEAHTFAHTLKEADLGERMLRVVDVIRNGVSCTEVPPLELSEARAIDLYRFSPKNPAYALRLVGGSTTFDFEPSAEAYISVIYMPFPFMYTAPEDGVSDETPTDRAVPIPLEEMVIEYAALKYRIQDEEPAQYQLYIEGWKAKIQLLYGVPGTQVEGLL